MDRWLARIKSLKKEQILILLLCGILLLVIAVPAGEESSGEQALEQTGGAAEQKESVQEPEDHYARTRRLEQRLKAILRQVEGIGETEVMLTLKSGGRRIVEKDLEQSQGKEENQGESAAEASEQASSSENTVYQRDSQGNETPYVTEELEPEVAGVLVIAQGAGNASVAAEITEAVMALFGVEAHKIKVMKME